MFQPEKLSKKYRVKVLGEFDVAAVALQLSQKMRHEELLNDIRDLRGF